MSNYDYNVHKKKQYKMREKKKQKKEQYIVNAIWEAHTNDVEWHARSRKVILSILDPKWQTYK